MEKRGTKYGEKTHDFPEGRRIFAFQEMPVVSAPEIDNDRKKCTEEKNA
jgi:hypothetical protein